MTINNNDFCEPNRSWSPAELFVAFAKICVSPDTWRKNYSEKDIFVSFLFVSRVLI